MTNILPQAANMNRGAWLLTEEIVECYRDIETLRVIGGVIWGSDTSHDHWLESHGVATPDAYWKVVIAWIVPNSPDARRGALDQYIVSVREFEALIGDPLQVEDGMKAGRASSSWELPARCDKG